MGQAKRNLEEVRARMISVAERWMFEPSEWEARAVAEIKGLPRVEVSRYPAPVLEMMRMKIGECHANAYFMEREDPEKLCKRVVGWALIEGQLVLHSVVRRSAEMFCVTPAPQGAPDVFTFIPDSDIVAEEIEGRFVHSRDGQRVDVGLRPDPEVTIEFSKKLLERLRSGMNPYKAMELLPPQSDF
ncbi:MULTISPECIES: hypothetical protein [unclassified Novosphingobium]|uniref:hypothetical protein n=1 Tax=unclassified Novosphingobium TaxID=2644732 RepID=UPI00146BB926|nr:MULTISPECIES: hypothetical protein [unclassified Novosphingobium]NMN07524.1 hypothetical protein [Novosphingobium sp. SG919]NMN89873.1 hypothetical protein [Novosphingobium sp. SG916]